MIKKISTFLLSLILVVTISPTWIVPTFAVSLGNPNLVAVTKKKAKKKVKKVVKKKVKKPVKPKPTTPAAQTNASATIFNGVALSDAQKKQLEDTYKAPLVAGKFWYDTKSGAYGVEGQAVTNFILPGHSLGTLKKNASNGDTGVILNGRELPQNELDFYTSLIGTFVPGSYWLDGTNGNLGIEGLDLPLANLVAGIKAAASQGASAFPGGGGSFYRSGNTDATIGSQGGCSYVSFGDGSSYSSSGC